MRRTVVGSFLSWRTLVTGVVFGVVEALYWNWQTAVALTLLLYLHEAGHVLAAHWRQVPVTGAPTFMPGFGAYVSRRAASPWDDLWIAAGGPWVGGMSALVCYLIGWGTGSESLLFAGHLALWFNLVNLAPVAMFDGSRMLQKTGPLRFAVLLVMVLLGLYLGAVPFWPVIGLLAGLMDLARNGRFDPDTTLSQVLAAVGMHIAMAGSLALAVLLSGPVAPPASLSSGGRLPVSLLVLLLLTLRYQKADLPGDLLHLLAWTRQTGVSLFRRAISEPRAADLAADFVPLLGQKGIMAVVRQLSREGHPGAALAAALGCQRAQARLDGPEAHGWVHQALVELHSGDPSLAAALVGYLQEWGDSCLALALEPLLPLPLPEAAEAAHAIACSHLQRKRSESAHAYARAAVIGAPGCATYHSTLAKVLQALGSEHEANLHQERAHRLDPTQARYAEA